MNIRLVLLASNSIVILLDIYLLQRTQRSGLRAWLWSDFACACVSNICAIAAMLLDFTGLADLVWGASVLVLVGFAAVAALRVVRTSAGSLRQAHTPRRAFTNDTPRVRVTATDPRHPDALWSADTTRVKAKVSRRF